MDSKEKKHIKKSTEVGILWKIYLFIILWKNMENSGTKCKNNSYLCTNRVKFV